MKQGEIFATLTAGLAYSVKYLALVSQQPTDARNDPARNFRLQTRGYWLTVSIKRLGHSLMVLFPGDNELS